MNELLINHKEALLKKLLNPYELELIFPKNRFRRNLTIPAGTARDFTALQGEIIHLDSMSGRMSSLAELRDLIEKHEEISNLSEKYSKKTFKAIVGRPHRLNLLSSYNKDLSAEFQTARENLLDLLEDFEQTMFHEETTIEKQMS